MAIAIDPSTAGLTTAEAAERLARHGANVLPVARGTPAWRVLAAQFVHFFALLLWCAAGLALVAGMPQLAIAIAAIIVLNGAFAFAQEHRAERAAERLRDLLPRRMTVVRDGRPTEREASEIVPGDVVLLSPGDRLSADLQLCKADELALDVSALTGESEAVHLSPGDAAFAGTFVVEGDGEAIVTATGGSTRLASVARASTAARRTSTPLARELGRVVRLIATLSICIGVGFFVLAYVLALPVGTALLFAIGVAVALVPEGLLPTVTLSLAVGAQRMAKRHALVRRLEAVESLGATTFICTDKTGTLTRNEMAVVEVWLPQGTVTCSPVGYDPTVPLVPPRALADSLRELTLAAARCSRGRAVLRDGRWMADGDPMEAAIDTLAQRLGLDLAAEEAAHPVRRRLPFDARLRRMSIVATPWLLLKGAPDSVLPLCQSDAHASRAVDEMAQRGLRVLAVAMRRLPAEPLDTRLPRADLERDLVLLGLLGLEDPPRSGVANALAGCRAAGIRVAMLTGDHPGTATAIAREVGLFRDGSQVFEAADLPADDQALGALVDVDGTIVCRVTPEDKLRVARALRARGHVLAMTGDGVNDGPALHEADIGVAMGRSGTDVAREASDLVLLDDNFATIVAAIEQGRATFNNVRHCLTYHLTDNVAELTPFVCWGLSAGQFPLALGVMQILALDIGIDQLPALGLGTEAPERDVLHEGLQGRHLLDGALFGRAFGVLGATEALVEMVAFTAVLVAGGWRLDAGAPPPQLLASASGAAFAAVVLGQLGNAFACRHEPRRKGSHNWRSNPFLLWGLATELVLLAISLFVPLVANVLGQAPPPPIGWLIAALALPAVLTVDGLQKRLTRKERQPGLALQTTTGE